MPPIGSTGVEIVANEMEGELATAGIKEAAKLTDVDFRNPCISIDFGTTLDGRITSLTSHMQKQSETSVVMQVRFRMQLSVVRKVGFESRDCT